MKPIDELAPPPTVKKAIRAVEVARIWIVDHQQHVSISGILWDDPAAWGLMLVDLAKHVANAYEKQGHNHSEVLKRIFDGFQAELGNATDTPKEIR